MKILVLNCGSSSIKYKLFDMESKTVMAQGGVEKIGLPDSFLQVKLPSGEKVKIEKTMPEHTVGIQLILDTLVDKKIGCIKDLKEIEAVGHRVVHGGEKFNKSVLITPEVKEMIVKCAELAPLHNPANLKGIEAIEKTLPGVPQVAVFDTAFHQTMPDYAYMYALPYEYYKKYGIRRYGFHGTSHRYITLRTAAVLGKKPEELKIVTCHLGNGSSVAAVDHGKCLDTSMGLTPLEGIIMGTRCGSIDPAIIPLLMEKEHLSPKEIDTIMNKKSGILGVSQTTSDNRDIENGAKAGNKRYQLIESMLCHQLTKLIGGYAAAMGGVDAVAFAGGIGENNPHYRTRVADKLAFLGCKIDEEKNKLRGEELDISTPDAKLRMLVIPTNEELMIAKDTYELVTAMNK